MISYCKPTLLIAAAVLLSSACSNSSTGSGSQADGGAGGAAGGGPGAGAPSTAGSPSAGNGGATSGSNGGGNSAGSTASGGTAGAGRAGANGTGGSSAGSSSGGSSGARGAGRGGSPNTGGTGGMTGGMAGGGGSAGAVGGTPSVRLVGRTAPGTGSAVRFAWPGTNINARFSGTQVSMDLNDGSNKNRYTVVVDGGTPKTVTTTSGQTTLALASGLANGDHEIVIWRNTEAPTGVTQFTGLSNFGTGGALLAPAAAPDRRIEVIGDSLSAGAGVEGTSTTCNPNIDAFTNNYLAYGSVAARSVKADLVTIAWSGIGVYRSYGGSAPTMPARYDFSIPSDSTAWDFAKYQPHVVVINLGTNDFSGGNPGQPYVDAYVAFIKHVRTKYAAAEFLLIDMYGGDRLQAINNVVTALKAGGESKVQTLSFSSVPNNNTACNQHPNVVAQKAMGDLLATKLKSMMNW